MPRFTSVGMFWKDIPEVRRPIDLPQWYLDFLRDYPEYDDQATSLPEHWRGPIETHEGEPLLPAVRSLNAMPASPWSKGYVFELVERAAGRFQCMAQYTNIRGTAPDCFVMDCELLSGPFKGHRFEEQHCLCFCDRDATISDRIAEIAQEIGLGGIPDRPSALLFRPFSATFHASVSQ